MEDYSIWSRPEHPVDPHNPEPILDHLVAVENHCLCNTPSYATLSTETAVRPVLQTMAWTHDLGKLTTWWQQDHDNTDVPSIIRPAGNVSDHSFLGGVATWWVLDQLGYDPYIRLIAGISVARHHNTLPNFNEYFSTQFTDVDRWDTVRHQIDNIDTHTSAIAKRIFDCISERVPKSIEQPNTELSWQAFKASITDDEYRLGVKQSVTQLTGQNLKREYESKSTYDDLLELWGGLKAADSPASAGVAPSSPRTLPDASYITEYVETELSPPESLGEDVDGMNHHREQTRQETLETLKNRLNPVNSDVDPNTGQIYTLTLPTGAGKTLTGTQSALHLHNETNSSGPLLYILPYNSIIEQTEQVYADLFGFDTGIETPTIGVDHYSADTTDSSKNRKDGEDTPNMETTSLWYDDITLSTAVQFWETVCGPSKSQCVKLPQLYESTIILDEPQSLPTEWFGRVEELLETLRTRFNANVILMSATQPPITYPPKSNAAETQEIAPEIEFESKSTVSIDSSVTTDNLVTNTEAANRLCDEIETGMDSLLSIHNTIKNTNTISNSLKSELDTRGYEHISLHNIYSELLDHTPQNTGSAEQCDDFAPTERDVYDLLPSVSEILEAIKGVDADVLTITLTARNRLCDRSRLLDALTTLLSVQTDDESSSEEIPQIVALTTQLVEPNVDVGFELLYRDLAPYEYLVQAAGRCNRDYEYGIGGGDMTVWHLDANGDRDETPAEYAHLSGGVNRIFITADTLSGWVGDVETIGEVMLLEGYQTYKDVLEQKLDLSVDYIENVVGEPLTRTSVIPDYRQRISVCVARTPTESKLIEAYREIGESDPQTRGEIRDILSHMECSIRVNEDTNIIDIAHQIDDTLYVVDHNQANTIYLE